MLRPPSPRAARRHPVWSVFLVWSAWWGLGNPTPAGAGPAPASFVSPDGRYAVRTGGALGGGVTVTAEPRGDPVYRYRAAEMGGRAETTAFWSPDSRRALLVVDHVRFADYFCLSVADGTCRCQPVDLAGPVAAARRRALGVRTAVDPFVVHTSTPEVRRWEGTDTVVVYLLDEGGGRDPADERRFLAAGEWRVGLREGTGTAVEAVGPMRIDWSGQPETVARPAASLAEQARRLGGRPPR